MGDGGGARGPSPARPGKRIKRVRLLIEYDSDDGAGAVEVDKVIVGERFLGRSPYADRDE